MKTSFTVAELEEQLQSKSIEVDEMRLPCEQPKLEVAAKAASRRGQWHGGDLGTQRSECARLERCNYHDEGAWGVCLTN